MTKSQIEHIFPNAHVFGTDSKEKFGIENFNIDKCSMSVDFSFRNDQLESVSLELQKDNEDPKYCLGLIHQNLESKYGKPYDKHYHSGGFDEIWKRKDGTLVEDIWGAYPSINTWLCTVLYYYPVQQNVQNDL